MSTNQFQENVDLSKKPFRFYIRRYPRPFFFGLFALALTNIVDAFPPLLVGKIIDHIAQKDSFSETAPTIGLLIAVALFIAFFRYFWRIHWGAFGHNAADDLRVRIFNRYTLLGPSFFQKNPIGQLMSLISNDVNQFRMAIGPGLLIFIDAMLALIVLPPIMMSISVSWTVKSLILMPLVPFFIFKVMRLIEIRFKTRRDKFSELSGDSQEIISGIRVIKAYAQETNKTRLYNVFNKNLEDASNAVARADAGFVPVLELGITSGAVILMFVGGPEVMTGTATIGSFLAFFRYLQRMIWPMMAIGISVSHFQQGKASLSRVFELLNAKEDSPDTGTQKMESFKTLEFRNVSFTYPGSLVPALKNVSFELKSGEILGIIGPTGAGKSTMLNLLARMYPPSEGEILINGNSIDKYPLAELRNLLSYVPQQNFLFSQSLQDNILLNADANKADLFQVTELVNMQGEIEKMPDRYSSLLGEKGVNLSGGQKQRLTIARGLIRRSPLVVLDDCLSAVDAKTESSILSSFKKHFSSNLADPAEKDDPTLLIVSHRLASMRLADRILVLDDGRVEALGNSQELSHSSPTFKKIQDIQFAKSSEKSEGGIRG